MFRFFILVCVISYIYNVPIFLLFMDSFCSFFVHVRLRSFRSMTSFFCSCPAPAFRIYDPFEFRFVCFVSRSKVKKFDDQVCPFFVHVRLRSFRSMTSFFCSCPAPVFRIYDPFEFRFVCFVSRSKVKKFDDQACPAPVFPIYAPPPPHPVSTISSVYARVGEGGVREGHGPWVTPARALVFLNML
jgi:hypothetical protein